MNPFNKITQTIQIILTILGISTPYPNVNITDIRIIKQEKGVYTQFKTENLINKDINRLLINHLDVVFIYQVQTYASTKPLFSTNYYNLLQWKDQKYSLNQLTLKDIPQVEDTMATQWILVYPANQTQSGKKLNTTIDIYFQVAKHPEVGILWGNEPSIHLDYTSP